MPDIPVDREPLTRDEVVAIVRHGARLTAEARKSVAAGRERVRALATGPDPAYGVSTGFGALATRHIEPELRDRLQRSLVRSHAAGAGAEVEREVVRAMLLRLRTLASGQVRCPGADR